MRKFFLIGLFFGLFISCNNIIISIPEGLKYIPPEDIEMPIIKDPFEILYWMLDNISYKSDAIWVDYWQAPHETVERKTGDCEDIAILIMYYFQLFEYETYIIIAKDGKGFHAIAEIDENTWVDFVTIDGVYAIRFSEPGYLYEEEYRYSWKEVLILKLFLY